jgi:hypothetical protein
VVGTNAERMMGAGTFTGGGGPRTASRNPPVLEYTRSRNVSTLADTTETFKSRVCSMTGSIHTDNSIKSILKRIAKYTSHTI